jgi:uncharacterized phage infection (PIP) family protein YhgE
MCTAQASRNKMIEELEGELKTSQGDVKAQIFELTALRKEVAELRAAAAAPPPEVDVSGDVEALKELLARGVRSDVDAAQAKLAVAEANIAALATDNETLQLEIRTLQEAQETATAAVNKIVGDLERELKETREEAEKLINEARAAAAASADKKEVEKLRQQLRKAQEELAVAVKKSDDILASSLAAKAVRETANIRTPFPHVPYVPLTCPPPHRRHPHHLSQARDKLILDLEADVKRYAAEAAAGEGSAAASRELQAMQQVLADAKAERQEMLADHAEQVSVTHAPGDVPLVVPEEGRCT